MKQLLFLHGALGRKEQFVEIRELLKGEFETHAIDFTGHGSKAASKKPFSIPMFADDVINWMNELRIGRIDIFGYSMGGYAALWAAGKFPERIGKIFTLATKFDWTEESSAHEVKMLDAAKIEAKVPAFARELEERHGKDNWKRVLEKTAGMMLSLGKNNVLKDEDLKQVNNEVHLSVGDRDKMVTIEETVAAYRNLSSGGLMVFPDTPHPIEQVDKQMLCGEIRRFFNRD
jgi:pimeloyl-ACP methyl ester carboxylesterase